MSLIWLVVISRILNMGVAWHRFSAFFNIYFKRNADGAPALGPLLPMTSGGKPIDFEDPDEDDVFGRGKIEDFTWKGMLDFTTCTECGRCQSQCPAWNTGKPLSPKMVIMDLRDHLYAKAPYLLGEQTASETAPDYDVLRPSDEQAWASGYARIEGTNDAQAHRPLVGTLEEGGVIDPDVLWSCTNCGACVEQCPVDIEHIDHINDMRRYQVLIESNFPSEAGVMMKNLENRGNPWGMGGNVREDWIKELDFEVPVVDGPLDYDIEYLFWVGCAGAIDDRAKKVTKAVAELLHIAGVEFAVLGNGETCSGDPARRMGNEFLFQMLAQENVGHARRRVRGPRAGHAQDRRDLPALLQLAGQGVPAARAATTRSSTTPSCSASWWRRAGSPRSPRSTARSPTTTRASWAGTTRSTRLRARSSTPSRASPPRRCTAARTAASAAAPAARACGWRRRSASGSTSSAPRRRSSSIPTSSPPPARSASRCCPTP